jgi:hypothetical protein
LPHSSNASAEQSRQPSDSEVSIDRTGGTGRCRPMARDPGVVRLH